MKTLDGNLFNRSWGTCKVDFLKCCKFYFTAISPTSITPRSCRVPVFHFLTLSPKGATSFPGNRARARLQSGLTLASSSSSLEPGRHGDRGTDGRMDGRVDSTRA